ncbi:MAG: DeoR/GlpR transcriptional regulator [Spirochaetes bacterium]|nr:MAG: DeoR/GlpR transcriptional regulator [Spirochaetota bacterium]
MSFQERLDEILKILTVRKKITVQELTERLKVSEVTVRKDLTFLEEKGKIVRVHGGAVLAEDKDLLRDISIRLDEHIPEKTAIADTAAELIHEGDTIYLDAGSTSYFLSQKIKDLDIRVLTNSLDVIISLSDSTTVSLLSTGGSFRKDARSFIGPAAIEAIANFQIETCFLGTTGFSKDGYFTAQNILEAQVKKAVIKASQRKVLLTDHYKYGVNAFSIFARADNIDILITDSVFPDKDSLYKLGMEIIFARQKEEN